MKNAHGHCLYSFFQFHKGAIETRQDSVLGVFDPCFNPRAHVGRDKWSSSVLKWRISFNPRAHVGRDKVNKDCPFSIEVSIHAPTWGATRDRWRHRLRQGVSIHAPTWGATVGIVETQVSLVFQSTRPRGARQTQLAIVVQGYLFQSTRPRGARRALAYHQNALTRVSIHAPTWGAASY